MYSILFFTATASLWATLRHLDRGGKRYLFALAAAGIIGLGFHMLYLFVSLVLAIWLIRRRRDYPQAWRRLLLALCAPIVFLLALMTVWMEAQNKIGHADEWGKFQLTNAFRQMFMIFTGDYHALHFKPTQYLGLFAVLVCMILTLSHLWRRRARRAHGDPGGADPHRFDGLFWLWCLLPTLLIAIGGLRSHRQLVGSWRYYIMIGSAAPLLMCSAAMLMRDARRERLAWIFSLGFAGIVFLNAVAFLVQPKLGLRAVVHHVSEEYRPSDLVLVSDHKSRSYGFVYYGLLGQKPAERPKEARHSKEILDWIDQQMTGHDRLWAVFYDDLDDDRLFKALSKAEARYKPQGPIFSHGGTRVGLYRRSPSFVPIKLSK